MKDNLGLTVKGILKSPHFKHATVVAGKSGLNKTVKWVHILELTQSRDYVNGNELILTTGAGWKAQNDAIIYLQQLIEKKVTALCIQLGPKFNEFSTIDEIAPEMIQMADDHNFPLIVFHEDHDCRYVDLVHSLHSMIINQDYNIFLEIEQFMQKLYLILLNPHSVEDILHFLHGYLDINVVYLPVNGQCLFIPQYSTAKQNAVLKLIENMQNKSVVSIQKGNLSIACRAISACSQDLAFLGIFCNERQLKNYELLILEKCSLIIAQEFLGSLYVQEKERQNREQWVIEWLNGSLDNQKINQSLQLAKPYIKPSGVVACIANFKALPPQGKKIKELIMNITSVARSLFEQQGFHMLCYLENQSMIYVLLNTDKIDTWKSRFKKAARQIQEVALSRNINNPNIDISFSGGKLYPELDKLKTSFENAKATLYVQEKVGGPKDLLYDDLHIHRIIIAVEKQTDLKSFVMDYLQPVIEYDNQPNNNLLKTLKTLCECQYNKQETAKRLFIARQSLYQRINTLEELLGNDFLSSPEKRICLEIALNGLDYLKSK